MDSVIRITGLGKAYRIWNSPSARFKSICLHCIKSVVPPLSAWCGRKQLSYYHDFHALSDVNIDIKRGESVAVIGKNGSGKSTLLQVIAGTLAPTSGIVEVNGRVAALLELGSGFNPEFTGRENVLLNATILGLSEREIAARLNDIFAFADIGEFVDQPVKTYSSGMLMRLAFAVQTAVSPDILIVDEALAVGDMFFQAKCQAHMESLLARGVSLLFVSHSLQTLRSLCTRGIYIESGKVLLDSNIKAATDLYSERNLFGSVANRNPQLQAQSRKIVPVSVVAPTFTNRITARSGSGEAVYTECMLFQDDREVDTLIHGEAVKVVAILRATQDLPETGEAGLMVRTGAGVELFAVNSFFMNKSLPRLLAGEWLRLEFGFKVNLAPGDYNIVLGYRRSIQGEYADKVFGAAIFRVVTRDGSYIPGLFKPADSEIAFSKDG